MEYVATPFSLHLGCDLGDSVLQIMARVAVLASTDDDPRCCAEQKVHLFEGPASSLGQDEPEEDGICQVANDENIVELVADVGHRNGCHLAL